MNLILVGYKRNDYNVLFKETNASDCLNAEQFCVLLSKKH